MRFGNWAWPEIFVVVVAAGAAVAFVVWWNVRDDGIRAECEARSGVMHTSMGYKGWTSYMCTTRDGRVLFTR